MRVSSTASMLGSLNNLIRNNNELRQSYERLSSGLRVNQASDDPAAIVISTQMRSQISGLQQYIRNLESLNNKYQTAEGHLATLQDNLQPIRDMIMAASNEGATTEEMREAYQSIVNNSVSSFNHILETVSYGSQVLFDGSRGSVADIDVLPRIDISDPELAEVALGKIDEKIDEILNLRAEIGARQKYEFGSQINNLQTEAINLTRSESAIMDTDMALEFANMTKSEIMVKAAATMLAHQNVMAGALLDILKH